jgi:hypothetical protein
MGSKRPIGSGTTRPEEKAAQPNRPISTDAYDKLFVYLPAGLTALTAAMGAVGGLTGGIPRMLRNDPVQARWTLALVVASVGLALLAQLLHGVGDAPGGREEQHQHGRLRGAWRWTSRRSNLKTLLVSMSILLFTGSLAFGTVMAVASASTTDRPSLSAELSRASDGHWVLKGTAGASGLKASDALAVYVYAYPVDEDEDQVRLLKMRAGSNADGVASHSFTVPLPTDRPYRSFVVTASVTWMRYCDGTPIYVSAKLNASPRDDLDDDEADITTSCMVLLPPPSR